MKRLFNALSITAMIMLIAGSIQAAVTQTRYRLKYNPATCHYDVYLIVVAGSTSALNERNAYPAQVTLVVPNGTTISNMYPNEPKTGSISGGVLTRTTAPNWNYSNSQTGSTSFGLNGFTAQAFTNPTSGTFYPALSANDTILLFSVDISTTQCGSGIRLWNNNQIDAGPGSPYVPVGGDPTSTQFNSKDFNNGHNFYSVTTGNADQTYIGNAISSTTRTGPTINSPAFTVSCLNNTGTMTASATNSPCTSGTLTYAWTGPTGVTLSTPVAPNILLMSASSVPALSGNYGLTVTDVNGCSAQSLTAFNPSPCTITTLPITLTKFDGVAADCRAQLNWEAANADKFQEFDVQYSSKGNDFATVGAVPFDKDNMSGKYSFQYQQAYGKGYYRLKLVDLDGKFTFSKVISVSTNCDGNANHVISIAPNPTTGVSIVAGVEAGDEIRVVDMLGNTVINVAAAGNNTPVDLSKYAAGVYNVVVVHNQAVVKAGHIVKK